MRCALLLLDVGEARRWVDKSLSWGSALAQAVRSQLVDMSIGVVIANVTERDYSVALDDYSRGLEYRAVDSVMEMLLSEIAERDSRLLLLVESD